MTFSPLRKTPKTFRWRFCGERDGYTLWANAGGRLFAQRNGLWFKVAK